MAKKKNIQLGIDLQVQNYESAIKALTEIEKQGGSVGKAATKLRQELEATRNSMVALGSTTTPQELKKFIKVNADLADAVEDLGKELKVTQEQVNKVKKDYDDATQSIKNYQKELDAAKKKEEDLNKARRKKSEIAEEKLKDPTNKGLSDKLAGRKDAAGKWKKAKELADKGDTDALNFVKEVDAAAQEEAKALQKVRAEIKQYEADIKKATAAAEEHKKTLNSLRQQHSAYSKIKESAEEASESINENNNALIRIRDAAVKAGEGQIKVSKATDETTTSFTKAARSVFNYTILYQGLKKVLRESVRTVKEMDDAITGMTVVTNLSREEAWQQVEAFQAIAKATSSTMTEIAGLTTEYLKQGRAMKDAKILAEETAKSAKIAGISTAEAVQYMTSAINGFNLAATDATRVSDVFANLAAASATDFEDLAIAVSKVSAQANLAGMSLEYTTALLAKGIETTQEAPESIGTALKTIVARMRELSSYGSVLEDGASVNKVERALASAGIELRNVNGEFRDLEEIFSELGPKWDYLNTMQQQAIAQAVAGTRQQSRFVAIMQDWGRTQELIAEANASEGASAAQYQEYAQGIEAALTRMKTSWEGFVQGLAKNKVIIAGVNTLTRVIEMINKIPDGLKIGIALYVAWMALHKVKENHEIKMKAYRQMAMTDEEKAQKIAKKTADEDLRQYKTEKLIVSEMKTKLALAEKINKKIAESGNTDIKSYATTKNLEVVQDKKKKLTTQLKDPSLTDSKRLEIQKQINALTKEEKQLMEQLEKYRQEKLSAREEVVQEILEKEKEISQCELSIKLNKSEIKSTIENIAKIDKDIEEMKQKAAQEDISSKERKELNTQIKKKEKYRERQVNRVNEQVDNMEGLSDQEKESVKVSVKDPNTTKDLLSATEDQHSKLIQERDKLNQSMNDTLVMGATQWNNKLQESTDKIAELNEQLQNTALTDEERKKIEEQISAEKEKQIAFEQQIKDIESQKQAANSELETINTDMSNLTKELESEDTTAERKLAIEQELDLLKNKQQQKIKEINDLEYGQIGLLEEKIEKEKELQQAKTEKETSLNEVETQIEQGVTEVVNEDGSKTDLLEQQKQLKSEILLLDTQSKDLQDQINLAGPQNIETLNTAKELRQAAISDEEYLAQLNAHQMTETELAMVKANEEQIKKLEGINQEIAYRKQLLQMDIQELQNKKKLTKDEQAALKKKQNALKNLNKTEQKNKKSIANLDKKNQKIQDGTYNVYSKMADLIGNKIGVNIQGMVDDFKTVKNFVTTLVGDFVKLFGQTALRKKAEEGVTDELEEQNKEKMAATGTDVTSLGTNVLQKETEEETTEEVQKQYQTTKGATLLEKVQLAVAKLMGKEEKKETMEDTTQVALEAGESIAEAGEQGASMNFAGMAIGIAGAVAALALAGIGAAVSLGAAGSGGAAGQKSKEDKVAAKQNANYEMKKSNANANKALDEYTALRDKAVRTEEEQQRMEELESEMQEMDEHFAGLKGEALIKAVRGRVAAQEVAIEDNIQDSFDIALTMSDISDSNVARQAIADKVINSQDKLIESNAALVDATDEEIQAIKNNASNMATELSKKVDWDKAFGTENRDILGRKDGTYSMANDYTGWDYAAQAAGAFLIGGLVNPIAGLVTGITTIGAMIKEDIDAQKQQNEMAEAISKFEEASTEMAINMEMAKDDLASQVQAYNDSIEDVTNSLEGVSDEFKDTALRIAESQYGTVAYIANLDKLTDSNNSLIDRITSIQKKTDGAVKEDALIGMADALVGSALENKNKFEAYRQQGSFGATSEERGINIFGGVNKEQDLASIAENLGMSADASVNEIKEKLASQIKRNEDGTLKVDKNGNYAFKDIGSKFTGNNKELTEIFNNLADFAEEIGYLADLSEKSIAAMESWNDSVLSAGDLLNNAFRTMDEQLLSTEELANADEDTKETRNAGYAFASAALEASEEIKKQGKKTIAELEADRANLDKTSSNYQTELKAINDSIAQVQTDMNGNSADMLAKAQEAIGYLDDAGWANRVEAANSRRERLQDIKDAVINNEDLTVEQIDLLYDEMLPALQQQDPSLTAEKFANIIGKKDLNTVKMVGDYLDKFLENEEASLQNTVGWNRRMKEFSKNELADYEGFKKFINSNGEINHTAVEAELDRLADAGEKMPEWASKYQEHLNWASEYEASKDKLDITLKALETEAQLTEDEIKILNLRADVASIKEDDSKHRLSAIQEELKYNKLLHQGLLNDLNKTKNTITSNLSAYGLAFDDVFTIVNGQVKINTELYKTLQPEAQEYITTTIEGLKEIAEEEYDLAKTLEDLRKEQLEETISLQETMLDAYKSKLEEEQEAVEKTLDKRKELYQEYFDWLNDQEDRDEKKNDIEILRTRIANLSGATDAASLKALKEAQEELADLEKESIQSEQEKIQEQILENLDKQSEQVAEYYDKQLEDNQTIIETIRLMSEEERREMLRAADKYYQMTAEQQQQWDQEYEKTKNGWETSNGATLDETADSVVIEEPEVEIETTTTTTTTTTTADTEENASSTTIHSTIHKKNKPLLKQVEAYAEGGLVDYTGPAWVDGTPGKPEAFLNAEQTALFGKLGETLVAMSSQGVFGKLNDISASTINNNLTIENFDITINADMKDDQDLYETGNNLADVFFERIQASGIPVNIKK